MVQLPFLVHARSATWMRKLYAASKVKRAMRLLRMLYLTPGLVSIFRWGSLGWGEGLRGSGTCGGRWILRLGRRGDEWLEPCLLRAFYILTTKKGFETITLLLGRDNSLSRNTQIKGS